MKKIILIIISIFLLNGCYDYQEITELAIIVSLGIDYKDDNYIVTYEILKDNLNKEAANISSYTITGSGKNLTKAFSNTEKKLSKRAYYPHVDIVLFSNSICQNHFSDVTDFLMRNKDIRENFISVVVDNPKEILSNTSKQLPVIGKSIIKALENDKYNNTTTLNKSYDQIITEILSNNIDTSLPKINIIKNKIKLEGIAIFNSYNMVNSLNNKESSTFNLLKNNTDKKVINKKYNNKDVSLGLYNGIINIDVSSSKIIIKGNVSAEVLENAPNMDLKDTNTIKILEDDFTKILNKEIKNLIKKLQDNQSDILGFKNIYYKKYRLSNNNLWINEDIKSNVKINISKKGIIYEVTNEQ